MAIEVESKFQAASQETLRRLATIDRLGRARLGAATVGRDLDRYLDTADERLAAAGWACRLRTRDERTIVSLKGATPSIVGDRSGLHRRPEVEGPATADLEPTAWPASAALELLLALAGGQSLEERLRLDQRRTERDVLLDGERVAILSLDEVVVLDAAGRSVGRMLVVELEHTGDTDADEMAAVADALRADPELAPDPLTKLEHASQLIAASRATE
ncbi:MAG: CYTH domain-containing protein [Chloroflexota bacterium]